MEEVEALQLEKTQLQHQLQICDKERAALEVWGDFDPASVMRLQEVGYQVNFYICSEKNFNEEWLDTYYATEVNRIGSRILFHYHNQKKERCPNWKWNRSNCR